MRNLKGLTMIMLALIAGLAAVMLAGRWLNDQARIATAKVAVATQSIAVGQPIPAGALRLMDWPVGSVPQGAFTKVEAVDGRVARVAIERDEPVLEAKLAPVGSRGGLSALIGEGKRAITVRVNDVVGVAGFALPGTHVDVIVSTRQPGAGRNDDATVSKIVLERILVLAVAQEANRDTTKPQVVNAVTLEVTPSEAEQLDLARSVGTLSLVLRNQVDSQPVLTSGATKDSLLGTPTPPPASVKIVRKAPVRIASPKLTPICVDALIGTERKTECF